MACEHSQIRYPCGCLDCGLCGETMTPCGVHRPQYIGKPWGRQRKDRHVPMGPTPDRSEVTRLAEDGPPTMSRLDRDIERWERKAQRMLDSHRAEDGKVTLLGLAVASDVFDALANLRDALPAE